MTAGDHEHRPSVMTEPCTQALATAVFSPHVVVVEMLSAIA